MSVDLVSLFRRRGSDGNSFACLVDASWEVVKTLDLQKPNRLRIGQKP